MKLKATLMLAFLVIASLDALSGEKRSPDPRWGKRNDRSQSPLKLKAAFDGGEYTDEHQRDKINNGEKRSPDPRKGGKKRKGRPSWQWNKKAAFNGGQPERF
ncbi:uncharacterized protein [Acropora muricata]|uniref:uncharacterized protein isoform X2 n=1 Tax=Acropora muricata TaxID=159855 RepID=UPI0034E44211